MTSTRALEDQITNAVRVIRAAWPLLLDPTTVTGTGTPSSDIITALDKRISLAEEIARDITRWVNYIALERQLTRTVPVPKSGGPARGEIGNLLDFLDRHAEWFSGQHAASRCAEQLTTHAKTLQSLTVPRRRDHVRLGTCPIEHWDGESETILPCGGRVTARIGSPDSTATCQKCHTTRSVAWWQWELGLCKPPLTAEAMARVLRERMGVTVTGQTVRNWGRQGIIDTFQLPHYLHDGQIRATFGPATEHPRFDQEVVMLQVAQMGRACQMCGNAWHGAGDLCTRCYVESHNKRSTKSRPKPPTPVAGARPAYRPGPTVQLVERDTKGRPILDENGEPIPVQLEWCNWGDMPSVWCGCGRHGAQNTVRIAPTG